MTGNRPGQRPSEGRLVHQALLTGPLGAPHPLLCIDLFARGSRPSRELTRSGLMISYHVPGTYMVEVDGTPESSGPCHPLHHEFPGSHRAQPATQLRVAKRTKAPVRRV